MATTKAKSWTDTNGRAEANGTHLEAMETTPTKGVAIELPKLDIRTINIRLIGESPLICHRWSKKAIQMIVDKQTGAATAGRALKVPEQDYHDSLYPHPEGGYGFPTIAFKNAAVTACTSLGKSITKVAARQAFHVMGELAKIEGEPHAREDMVRVGQGTADVRYRGCFDQWETTIRVRYNARVLSAPQIINLFNTAGFAVGVGEWRSEKDGSYGLFRVAKGDD